MRSGDETTHNRLYAVITWPGTWLIQIHWIVWLFHLIMMIIIAMKGEKWDLLVFLLLQNVKLCLRNVVGIKRLTIFIVGFYHAFLFHEYVTRHEKTGLMYTKYTSSYYGTYLLY